MPAFIDLTSQKYGRLTVLSRVANSSDNRTSWLCKCDCGNEATVRGNYLKNGKTTSCGCYQKEAARAAKTTHGRSKTRAYYNEQSIKHSFGIEYADYLKMAEAQDNKCAICGCEETVENRRLAIDHCHTSGQIRGLLCGACNRALGGFKDNPELLSNAIQYLNKYSNAR